MSVLESLPQLHFYVFALLILGGALGFLLSRSFLHRILWFELSMIGVAATMMLLNAMVLAAIHFSMFAGGIAVLLYYANALDRNRVKLELLKASQWESIAISVLVGAVMVWAVLQMAWEPSGDVWRLLSENSALKVRMVIPKANLVNYPITPQLLGVSMSKTYIIPLILSGLLMLLVVVGVNVILPPKEWYEREEEVGILAEAEEKGREEVEE